MKFKKRLYGFILVLLLIIFILMMIELFWPRIIPNNFINFEYLRDYIFIISYVLTTIIALIGFLEKYEEAKLDFEVGYKTILIYFAEDKNTWFHFPITFSNSGKATGIIKKVTMELINIKTNDSYIYEWHTFCNDDFKVGFYPRETIKPIGILPMNVHTDIITFENIDKKFCYSEDNNGYELVFKAVTSSNEEITKNYKWNAKKNDIIPINKKLNISITSVLNFTHGNYDFNIKLDI